MKIPRYSLRTIFVLVTLIGILLAWRQSNIQWMNKRRNALEWLYPGQLNFPGGRHGIVANSLRLDINNAGEGLPWSVRFWGHGELALTQLGIISDELTPETSRRVEEIKALFPECVVIAKTREEWRREMNLPNL